ncbi:hypothetical protein VTN00DRAFT_10153 [Thermoascus crustaceus]|uniref:uncharacterized protein n=1 Tax=Thermoascus crustaceus TaxID=5088 RepID=UPI0037421DA1
MDQTHARALEALQPFVHLANSTNTSSPRFIANIITNATSNPHTYVFAELLETPTIQSLQSPDTPDEYKGYLKLLEIFAWGTWEEYQSTPNLPPLNHEQTVKLRLLSLLTLSTTLRPLTYGSLMKALSIPTPSDLESLVTRAIYSSLITARLSPATNPPTVHVSSVAPLRDIRPQTVATMISVLSEWEGRCGDVIGGIEAEIARIKAQAQKNRTRERERAAILEKSITGWEGDDDGTGAAAADSNTTSGRSGSSKFNLRKDGGGAAAGSSSSKLRGGGGGGNKREFNADEHDDDDGYWDNGSDGALDSSGLAGSSRMDIDEGAGAASSSSRGGGSSGGGGTVRQAKRILNMGKKH